jgi:hypothetical protein
MKFTLYIGVFVFSGLLSLLVAKEPQVLPRNPEALALALANLSDKARQKLHRVEIQHELKERIVAQKYKGGFADFKYLPDIPIGDYLDDIIQVIGHSAKNDFEAQREVVIKGATVYFSAGASGTGGSEPEVELSLILVIDAGEQTSTSVTVSGYSYHNWGSYEKNPKTRLYFAEATYRSLMLLILRAAGLLTVDEVQRIGFLMPPRK